MTNAIKLNKKYLVSGRYVKVIKVSDTHVEVVWGHNGVTPRRQCDRFFSHSMTKYFVEV